MGTHISLPPSLRVPLNTYFACLGLRRKETSWGKYMPETNVCQQSRTIWAAEPERARRKRGGQRARDAALASLAPCQNNACGIGNQCESVEAEDKSDAVPLPRKAKEDVEKKLKRRKDASCLPLHVWKTLNELIRMAPTTNVRRNRWNQRLTTS